jgi:ring-1,2-phenylacetyl-CoA epoxidase subunit PaaD
MVSLAEEVARQAAARVVDPEMPMLTLADLGVLRDVAADDEGVTVWITPTYSGCPATAAMRDDLVRALQQAGFDRVEVRLRLDPAWSSDWLSERGREALAAHGLSAPGPAPRRTGPVPLTLAPTARQVRCPRCGSSHAQLTSEFGPTACTALYRCGDCLEPFEHMKEI